VNPRPILDVKNFGFVKILGRQKNEERLEKLRNPIVNYPHKAVGMSQGLIRMLQAPYTNRVMDTKSCVDRQVSAGKLGARATRHSGDVRAWHVLQRFYTVPATAYPCIIPEEFSGTHTENMDAEDINAVPKNTGKVTHPQFPPQINPGTSLRRSS